MLVLQPFWDCMRLSGLCSGESLFVRGGGDAVMTECGGWRKSRDRQVDDCE